MTITMITVIILVIGNFLKLHDIYLIIDTG